MDDPADRRLAAIHPPLNVVLVEPLIPQNTGNIGRLCVGSGSVLHLVEPLGFDISEKAVRRAGLDYWPDLGLRVHADWDSLVRTVPRGAALIGTSKRAKVAYCNRGYRPGDFLVFGKETTGLGPDLLADLEPDVVCVPRLGPVRSHNLGNTVAIVLYEALRQITGGFPERGGC